LNKIIKKKKKKKSKFLNFITLQEQSNPTTHDPIICTAAFVAQIVRTCFGDLKDKSKIMTLFVFACGQLKQRVWEDFSSRVFIVCNLIYGTMNIGPFCSLPWDQILTSVVLKLAVSMHELQTVLLNGTRYLNI
jgi:hypothetical protein